MKLLNVRKELKAQKEFPGIINCSLEYKIESATGYAVFLGPKMPAEVWAQVLSFFRWTYDTTKSESQVRLYLNSTRGVWDAWAYPQEANTGMMAHEIDNDQAKSQRCQYPDGEGWIYFGTVHHHCSATAFQSGTDENNERGQDGLHITVGQIDKEQHDLDCRFYLNGAKFDPDMSEFWHIGDELLVLTPHSCWDVIARHQMGRHRDIAFPDIWKANLIMRTPVTPTLPGPGKFWTPGVGWQEYRPNSSGSYLSPGEGIKQIPLPNTQIDTRTPWQREIDAAKTVLEDIAFKGIMPEEVIQFCKALEDEEIMDCIAQACRDEGVSVDELIKDMERLVHQIEDEKREKDPLKDFGGMYD